MSAVVCASGLEVLMEYLEGGLSPAERAAIEMHVAACERCTAFVASYQATPLIVRRATAADMPAGLQESLLDALRKARGRPPD